MLDERLLYWTQGWPRSNLGDYLTEYLYDRTLGIACVPADRYRLVGSVIDPIVLDADLAGCDDPDYARIALWCCGMREDRPLPPALIERCLFRGVRGPLSRDRLALPIGTPLGDPGLLMPLLRPAAPPDDRTLCIPHYEEPRSPDALLAECGADRLLPPTVSSTADFEALVDAISSARFVLAGALHAAIIACAYEVPFAFWDTGFIDVPFKWRDFAASLGTDMRHVATVADGQTSYDAQRDRIVRPPLAAILDCCPFTVRPGMLAAALARDAGLPAVDSARLVAAAGAMPSNDPATIERARIENRRMRAGNPADAHPAAEVDEIARLARSTADMLTAQADALSFRFTGAPRELGMAAGQPGAAYLGYGWSPPNDVAPWTLGSSAEIALPGWTGWHGGTGLEIGAYLIVPERHDGIGGRAVQIWLNGTPALDTVILPQDGGGTQFAMLHVPIPSFLRARRGRLVIRFHLPQIFSLHEAGLGEDRRQIGLAPVHMRLDGLA